LQVSLLFKKKHTHQQERKQEQEKREELGAEHAEQEKKIRERTCK
jgi:hypothetical protein